MRRPHPGLALGLSIAAVIATVLWIALWPSNAGSANRRVDAMGNPPSTSAERAGSGAAAPERTALSATLAVQVVHDGAPAPGRITLVEGGDAPKVPSKSRRRRRAALRRGLLTS